MKLRINPPRSFVIASRLTCTRRATAMSHQQLYASLTLS
jgi:hypothetical protein